MDENKTPANSLQAKGMLPSMLAGLVLLVGGIFDAVMLYSYGWYRSSLIIIAALAFLAYCLGIWIEKRRGA
jgi:hypothetical protein